MAITKDTVKYVAKLSRIELEESTIEDFTSQLARILNYIEKLNQLDTENTAPTSHALELRNVYRKDVNTPSLENQAALSNAPEQEDGHFKVPKII
ncbi:MAG: Asp-tRNA(Asn)/Glu-tRNA(Gln) amidotransferase subunit GatC [Candidatus Omnitrophica bacterium]|nr:Asp-tRNA(Asn)/Glu-tRNA(Gln) amidotransferase subunit GatC [Candidatus Omnitrophota bacterium]